ncbi:MAG: S16 family serine protease [Candidatus Pacearchaeota archaeon]
MMLKVQHYVIAIFLILLSLFVGFFIGINSESKINNKSPGSINLSDIGVRKAMIYIGGVNSDGRGSSAVLETTLREGGGLILVNINNLTAGSATQESARLAVRAAKNYLNLSKTNNFDVIYNIKSDASFIDGPSGGAAMAITLISILENKSLNPNVSITGFVDEAGIIGPASGIEQKISALKDKGIKVLLVSEQVALPKDYIRKESCYQDNKEEYCEINYVSGAEINILGIRVIQIKDIKEALKYFYSF